MVVKMMKWRPWPPMAGKKFHVNMVVQSLQGLSMEDKEKHGEEGEEGKNENVKAKLTVEIKWKGGKGKLSSPFKRRSIKTNCTGEQCIGDNGIVEWNEEFDNVCLLTMLKDSAFHPWDVTFSIISGLSQESKSKPSVIGTAFLNLGEYASTMENINRTTKIPVTCCTGGMAPEAALSVALNFVELRTVPEAIEPVDRISVPSTSSDGGSVSSEKEELSALKAGLRKVKIFRGYVGVGRAKKACREEEGSDGRISSRSEEYEYADVFDTDSGNECDEDEIEDKDSSSFRKSFSYGTLAAVNRVEGIYFGEDENNDSWVTIHKTQVESISRTVEEPCSSDSDHALVQPSMRSLLSWKKRKLSFRSPRARGEPLLNKAYGEEGGDDIDFDRRQLCSPWSKSEDGVAGCVDFGDDHFTIGSWEQRDLVSRDGQMKLSAQVFFATIDQRSERAAGESACTALVAVIADWLHNNTYSMPIKSQFDTLIREGSLEWRNLCEIESYRERFPDRHFDLDTVLEAKIRSLSVTAEKSFVGFFRPEGLGDSFDFLQEAMSFDDIWEEIQKGDAMLAANSEPQIYIVSWNDHFFVLKVEKEAYYIIDTLGERLFEGCNQAYILKFDKDTTVYQLPEEQKPEEEKSSKTQSAPAEISKSAPAEILKSAAEISKSLPTENGNQMQQGGAKVEDASPGEIVESKVVKETLICKGKESCKEFIKGFWAAVPLRELEIDIKKGLLGRVPLHHRLQIEFHFTAQSSSTSMDLTVG
ncbi:uncharacterized protein LOC131037479 isoform X1 [Cryptomeria japonica]|uniref:uncharacterized protein LOC131037479 isoform X1 n=1 Tax=Cryptomeria japonica TaxID=3369 RepID=UPI0027D9E06B|nr:uncharacterized protein LOC131037479 isoform X1 [Cryptomeria japonica]